jgi:putative transcriptional regulator
MSNKCENCIKRDVCRIRTYPSQYGLTGDGCEHFLLEKKKTLGERIRERRLAKGWTQDKMGEIVGLFPSSLGNYERDRSVPNVYTAFDIADAFGCSIYELVGRDEKK